MGLIDVVKRAQSLGPLDAQGTGLSGLKPIWLISEEASSAKVDNGELVSWRGVPGVSEHLREREDQEKRLIVELKAKADDSLSLAFLDDLFRPYFEQVLSANLNPGSSTSPEHNPNSNHANVNSKSEANASGHPLAGKKRVPHIGFAKLLKKASPLLGQKLLSSILRACLVSKSFNEVKAMLESHALGGNIYPDFVLILIEHDQVNLLCMWVQIVCDPRFSDLLLVLRYFLKSSIRAGKSLAGVRSQWRQAAIVAIQRVSEVSKFIESNEECSGNDKENTDAADHTEKKSIKEEAVFRAFLLSAAVDHFQPYELCLHYLVSSGHDEAVLTSILSQLDNNEVLKLLRYLKKWLEKYSRSLCALQYQRKELWVPSLGDIIQWASVLIDAHLMSLVLCSDFHAEIQSVQLLIKGFVDVGHKYAPLVGVTEHLRSKGFLPAQKSLHGEDDHVIEYLEI